MPYIVFSTIENASIIQADGKAAYAEYYEEEQEAEAREYFRKLVRFGFENRERLTMGAAGDYKAAIIYAEDENSPRQTLQSVTITPHRVVSLGGEEAKTKDLERLIREEMRGLYAITEEPTDRRQAEEMERIESKRNKGIGQA